MRIYHKLHLKFPGVPREVPPGTYPAQVTIEVTDDGDIIVNYDVDVPKE